MQSKPSETKLCECGCGAPAPIAKYTNSGKGWVKGEPKRFVNGHNGVANKGRRLTPEHRAKLRAAWKGRSATRKGWRHTPETRARISSAQLGERHPRWSGDAASYKTIHEWLRTRYPKRSICAGCGRECRTHWAFLRHPAPHTRDIADYRELCPKCHSAFDSKGESVG